MGSKRKIGAFVDDILESIQMIEQYSSNLREEEFKFKFKEQDAIFRRLWKVISQDIPLFKIQITQVKERLFN